MTAHLSPGPSVQPRLHTGRLILRPFGADDFPGMRDLYAQESTARFIGGCCTEEDAWRRMASMVGHYSLRGYGIWALELGGSGAFAGYCGLWNPHGWPEREIAWALLSQHQGKGYATEAAACARDYAYTQLQWPTVVSCIAIENEASIRVARRLGATLERTTVNRGWTVGVFRHPGPGSLRPNPLPA